MPGANAGAAWLARQSYKSRSAADRAERERILQEPYTEQARRDKLRPVEASIRKHFEEARASIKKAIHNAESAYARHRPTTAQRILALKDPQRAIAIRELAKDVRPADLVSLAQAVAQSNDGPGAFGLRQAVVQRSDAATLFSEIQAFDFFKALDSIGEEARTDALADMVAARAQLFRLEVNGQDLDPANGLMIKNPVEAAGLFDSMRVVEVNEGTQVSLSEDRLKALCEHASVSFMDND